MPFESIRCSPPQREMPRKVSAAAADVINSFTTPSFSLKTELYFLVHCVKLLETRLNITFFFLGKKKADKEGKSKGNKEVDKHTKWRPH